MDFKTISSLGRFKDIVWILLKYGFEDLVERLDLPGRGLVSKIPQIHTEMGTYERIRHALEELGPTFVKFGQVMSLRPEFLPAGLLKELEKLQDDVASIESEEIRQVAEESLQTPLNHIFSFFEEQPLAAASLSQVHRARLLEENIVVAVKVQRPNIRKTIQRDLDILAAIAQRLHDRIAELQVYDLPNVVRIGRQTLLRELDFRREARHMRIARANLERNPGIYIPQVYESRSTARVLIMEFVQGNKLKDLDVENLAKSQDLAKTALNSLMKQILEDGFFHADPHPGNLLITESNGICLLDWGMVGRLPQGSRNELIDLIRSATERDSERVVNTLLSIGKGKGGQIDERGLESDILDILDSYMGLPLKDLHLGQLLLEVTSLMREYSLRVPPNLSIMVKALVGIEGSGRMLYPDLEVIKEAEAHVKRLTAKRYSPRELLKRFRANLAQLMTMQQEFPRRLGHIMDKLEHGELSLRFEHRNLEGIRKTLDHTFNRLTFGIIIAAMIIGSSMIITTGVRPLIFGFPALGIIGYMISALLGLWLVFSIIRTRRY